MSAKNLFSDNGFINQMPTSTWNNVSTGTPVFSGLTPGEVTVALNSSTIGTDNEYVNPSVNVSKNLTVGPSGTPSFEAVAGSNVFVKNHSLTGLQVVDSTGSIAVFTVDTLNNLVKLPLILNAGNLGTDGSGNIIVSAAGDIVGSMTMGNLPIATGTHSLGDSIMTGTANTINVIPGANGAGTFSVDNASSVSQLAINSSTGVTSVLGMTASGLVHISNHLAPGLQVTDTTGSVDVLIVDTVRNVVDANSLNITPAADANFIMLVQNHALHPLLNVNSTGDGIITLGSSGVTATEFRIGDEATPGQYLVDVNTLSDVIQLGCLNANLTFNCVDTSGVTQFQVDTAEPAVSIGNVEIAINDADVGTITTAQLLSLSGMGNLSGTLTSTHVPVASGVNTLADSNLIATANELSFAPSADSGNVLLIQNSAQTETLLNIDSSTPIVTLAQTQIIPTSNGDVLTVWNAAHSVYLMDCNSTTSTVGLNAQHLSIDPNSDNSDVFDVYQNSTGHKIVQIDTSTPAVNIHSTAFLNTPNVNGLSGNLSIYGTSANSPGSILLLAGNDTVSPNNNVTNLYAGWTNGGVMNLYGANSSTSADNTINIKPASGYPLIGNTNFYGAKTSWYTDDGTIGMSWLGSGSGGAGLLTVGENAQGSQLLVKNTSTNQIFLADGFANTVTVGPDGTPFYCIDGNNVKGFTVDPTTTVVQVGATNGAGANYEFKIVDHSGNVVFDAVTSTGIISTLGVGTAAGTTANSGTINLNTTNAAGNIVLSSAYTGTADGAICLNGASVGSGLGNAAITFISAAGTSYIDTSTGAFVPPSDMRLKKDIRDVQNGALDIIGQMKPKIYKFKNGTNDIHGFLAQDLKKINFTGAMYNKEADSWGIDYNQMIPLLVKSIQELTIRNNELTERVNQLTKKIIK